MINYSRAWKLGTQAWGFKWGREEKMARFWRREIHPFMQYKLIVYCQPREATMVPEDHIYPRSKKRDDLGYF